MFRMLPSHALVDYVVMHFVPRHAGWPLRGSPAKCFNGGAVSAWPKLALKQTLGRMPKLALTQSVLGGGRPNCCNLRCLQRGQAVSCSRRFWE